MRASVTLLLLASASCTRTAPVTAPVARGSDRPSEDRPAAPVDPLAAIRARGALHGAAVRLPPRGDRAEGTLAFTGTADAAWGAWVLVQRAEGPELRAVEHWPSGVKVVLAEASPTGAYVLVETVAALDRPAGQRSVISLSGDMQNGRTWTADAAPPTALRRVAEITDGPSLLRVMDDPSVTATTGARCDALRRARTPAALAGVAANAGVEHFVRYPDGLVVRSEVLAPAALGASSVAATILAHLGRTSGELCDVDDDVHVIEEAGALRVATVLTPAPPAPAGPRTGALRAVTGDGDRAEVVRQLRARVAGDPRVVAAAPLTAQGGTVAVAVVDALDRNVLVVIEGAVTRVIPFTRAMAQAGEGALEVRFVDGDGDGRTDVALEASAEGALAHRGLYLTPPASMAADLRYDLASALAMNTAASLDAAVAALGRVPWRGVAAREACAVVQATRTLAGLRRVATADLRVVNFEEPGFPSWRATYRPLSAFTAAQPPGSGAVGCANLACEADRPVCTGVYDEPGPGSTAYWFAWDGAALKLAAYALYTGS